MAKLHISNIGPVKDIDISLNRLNVLIGPQSSGKSTVAKILSFCHWMEKDSVVRQSVDHIDNKYVEDKLIRYYNISDYISSKSKFHYEGNALIVDFADNQIAVKMSDSFGKALSSKNAYIPSERNVIGIPGIFTTKMPDNYLLEFIDDWQQIRLKYSRDDKLSLLNLGGRYFFNASEGVDMIKIDDDSEIHFSQASSGMQSAAPLCVCIDYLTQWIYSHDEDSSAQLRQIRRQSVFEKALNELSVPDAELLNRLIREDLDVDSDDVAAHVFDIAKDSNLKSASSLSKSNAWVVKLISRLIETDKKLAHSDYSNIVVEEPEQNLFPETQVKLIYYILSKLNHGRDNLMLTTHSPYILYALNNCMLAMQSLKSESPDMIAEMTGIPEKAIINPMDVSVWELDNGLIRGGKTIQDDNGIIRGNYFDRVMHNVMADFHNLLTIANI